MTLKSTKECATIEIVSLKTIEGQTEKTELTSLGEFYEKDGVFYITYKEHADMGMGDSRVFLRVCESMVTIRRMGEFKSVMNYEEGKITESVYRTPFGAIDVKIKTLKITNKLLREGGSIKMSYLIYVGGESYENEIFIKVESGEEEL